MAERQPLVPPEGSPASSHRRSSKESEAVTHSDDEGDVESRGPNWLPTRAGREEGAHGGLRVGARCAQADPLRAPKHADLVEGKLMHAASVARRWAKLKKGKPQASKHVVYNPRLLLTWSVLRAVRGTVLDDGGVLWNIAVVSFVALVSCVTCFLAVPDLTTFKPDAFYAVVLYVKVFIAFMLGMFLSNCLGRWWDTVVALTDLFMCIRKITWLCNTHQVQPEVRDIIQRHAVLSCLVLEAEVSSLYEPPDIVEDRWVELQGLTISEGLATRAELDKLSTEADRADRSLMVWAWIGKEMGTLKLPPPVLTMALVCGTDAIGFIKKIKSKVQTQMPLMYTHMLAFLVHLNNLMLAVATGVSTAIMLGDVLHAFGGSRTGMLAGEALDVADEPDRPGKLYRAVQGILVAMLSLLVQPVIYHAFLQIGAILADPFTHESHGLPMLDYTVQLRSQLKEMNEMADQDVAWLMDNAPAGAFGGEKLFRVVKEVHRYVSPTLDSPRGGIKTGSARPP